MTDRYQQIDEKNQALHEWLKNHSLATDFLARYEMSWIYHDSALEGVVFTPQELSVALRNGGARIADASLMPAVLALPNIKAAVDFARETARAAGSTKGKRSQPVITLPVLSRLHELFCGNTPEALATRAAAERRERSERELAKERDRHGFRREMPLHRTYFHEISQPGKIQAGLEKLGLLTASTEFREMHPIRQAAMVQHQFLQVFPFAEKSGLVGRMASNLILLRHDYLPAIIHSVDRQRYYEALRGPVVGFRVLLMDAMENSLNNALKFFEDDARPYRAVN